MPLINRWAISITIKVRVFLDDGKEMWAGPMNLEARLTVAMPVWFDQLTINRGSFSYGNSGTNANVIFESVA
jgi:hypothetical protein